jgi:metallophosphoesterase (TIGR03767 family)
VPTIAGRAARGLATDTTRARIERGPDGPGGWRDLRGEVGEHYQQEPPSGEVLGCIWHLSDIHLCDAESPARLEYLDRYSDPDSPHRDDLGDIGTYRPQEALTVQVAVAMVEAVNANQHGPTTGAPIGAVLLTGDLTDNAQLNELSWYQRVVEGGVISPRSGAPELSSWVGATDPRTWDERYWHPDGPPSGVEPDRPTRVFGYPAIPGLVAAARADVTSPGLALPWISVYGNHDGLLQGTVPIDDELRALAVGGWRIAGLPEGATPLLTAAAIAAIGPASYVHDGTSPRVAVAPDPARVLVEGNEFARTTRPEAGDDATLYFARDLGRLRVIALDTINPYGGWQGSLSRSQFEWLVRELDDSSDRYVVITSHHPSPTLLNAHRAAGAEERVLGAEVVSTLLAYPHVIAWIAGHVHFHAAIRHGDEERGFVELTTSSLIDWPQQGRILEFVRVADQGRREIAIISTVVDHAAPAEWSHGSLDDPVNLAAISRALAANDYRLREGSRRGLLLESSPEMRNVVWRVPDPFA